MAEKITPTVHIGQLNLRLPGRNGAMGQRVAAGVVENLTRQLALGLEGHLGAVGVRVRLPAGASELALSDAISAAIVGALGEADPAARGRH